MNLSGTKVIIFIATLFVVLCLAVLLAIDSACHPISNHFCRLWLSFQWETIVAGLLGLSGGAFAWIGVVKQIRSQRKDFERNIAANKRRYNIQLIEFCSTIRDTANTGLRGFQETIFPKGMILMVKAQLESIPVQDAPIFALDEIVRALSRLQNLKREALVFLAAYEPYLSTEEIWHASQSKIEPKDGHISNILKEIESVAGYLISLAQDELDNL